MKQQLFWLVWSPTGAAPPRHRHDTYAEAKREAERLAECSGRAEFFVLRAISRSQKVSVVTQVFEGSDLLDNEVPF